ncbi:MAG TPA: YggS family pyridoxal phosphate-dependent enzyme [Candidatus Limnocylindrales bacterium]
MDRPSRHELDELGGAYDRVRGRIATACARSGRDPSGVRLVAVSKTVSVDRLRAAVSVGIAVLGENRVQEAEAKVGAVPGASWHLVGPLQSNKVRRAVAIFDLVETVDSLDLARRLDRIVAEERPGGRLPVLLQVNVDRDPAKAGFVEPDLVPVLDELLRLPALEVRGLMTVGRQTRQVADTRATFRALQTLGDRLRSSQPGLGPELSMGMSDDFELAIEEGATIVRVGRALFGERPHEAGHVHGRATAGRPGAGC